MKTPDSARPTVVLLHSSASSARQWQALRALLAPAFRVHALDLHGHGTQPAWPGEAPFTLAADAALVEPLLDDGPAYLVGHSYGAAVALKAATLYPRRVRGVATYEPVLFALLRDEAVPGEPLRQIVALTDAIGQDLLRGDADAAAGRFVHYWSGSGAWQALAAGPRQAIAARMPAVQQHFGALLREPLVGDLAVLAAPLLFLTGTDSALPARRIGQLLRAALPHARHEALAGMHHMSPITDAPAVNARIEQFLRTSLRPRSAPQPVAELN